VTAERRCPGAVALVLSGGGARGAYEAGVLRYVREALPALIGFDPRFDVVSGTSIGAVNACFLTAAAEDPRSQATRLADVWLSLRLEDVFHWSALALSGLPVYLFRQLRAVRLRQVSWRLSDFLYPEALARVVRDRIDWGRLHANVKAGRVGALTVTATDLGTGRSVVFVETERALPSWSRDPLVEVRRADGSVRQNTPLAPAIRLGADRLLVVGVRHLGKPAPARIEPAEAPTTAAQLGRLLSALLLDRTDYDLERLRALNSVIEEGERVFGAGFGERLAALSARQMGAPLRRIRDVVIRPSQDVSALARDIAARRVRKLRPGTLASRLLRRAAADVDAEIDGAADLASYLLFDREFAGELMALGFRDAAAQREALAGFFEAPAEPAVRSA